MTGKWCNQYLHQHMAAVGPGALHVEAAVLARDEFKESVLATGGKVEEQNSQSNT